MESSRKAFLLNRAVDYCAKYGKFVKWSIYGLTTFYAMKYCKNHFLAWYRTKNIPLPANSAGPNLSASPSLEEHEEALDVLREYLLPASWLNPDTTDTFDTNPLVAKQPDTKPEAPKLPNANISTINPLEVYPKPANSLDANFSTVAHLDSKLSVGSQPGENPEAPKHSEANLLANNSIEVHPKSAASLDKYSLTLSHPDSNWTIDNQLGANSEAPKLLEANNISTTNLLEVHPKSADSLDANSSALVHPDSKPLVANQPGENSEAERFPEGNLATTNPLEVHPKSGDSLDANFATLSATNLIQLGENLADPSPPDIDSKSTQSSSSSLLELVPKALLGKQSPDNLEILLNYLDSMEWSDLIGSYDRYPVWEKMQVAPATLLHRESLKYFIGPFSKDKIELPDLTDEAAVFDYIEQHINLSQKYFEEGEYVLGFYHFVLIHFSDDEPMDLLHCIREVIEDETYLLAKRFLENLIIFIQGPLEQEDEDALDYLHGNSFF